MDQASVSDSRDLLFAAQLPPSGMKYLNQGLEGPGWVSPVPTSWTMASAASCLSHSMWLRARTGQTGRLVTHHRVTGAWRSGLHVSYSSTQCLGLMSRPCVRQSWSLLKMAGLAKNLLFSSEGSVQQICSFPLGLESRGCSLPYVSSLAYSFLYRRHLVFPGQLLSMPLLSSVQPRPSWEESESITYN